MNQPSLKLWRASCRLTRIGFATLGLVHLSAFFALFLTYEALAKWIRGYSGFKCLFFAPLRLCVRFWLCRPSSAFLQTIPELRHFFRRLPSSFFLHAFCIAVLALFIEWLRRRVRKVSDASRRHCTQLRKLDWSFFLSRSWPIFWGTPTWERCRIRNRFLPLDFRVLRSTLPILFAPVAQLDRASDYGSEGCVFESRRVQILGA
jgi:hypothetical protein